MRANIRSIENKIMQKLCAVHLEIYPNISVSNWHQSYYLNIMHAEYNVYWLLYLQLIHYSLVPTHAINTKYKH